LHGINGFDGKRKRQGAGQGAGQGAEAGSREAGKDSWMRRSKSSRRSACGWLKSKAMGENGYKRRGAVYPKLSDIWRHEWFAVQCSGSAPQKFV